MHNLDWRLPAGWAALAAPVLMWSEFFSMGLTRQGYNLLTRPFSDLATRGTPNASAFDFGFFLVPGALTIILGFGLWFAGNRTRTWNAGSVMVVVAGVFFVATGLFPQDPHSSSAAILHGTMSQTCFAIASAVPVVLFAGSSRHAPALLRRLWLGAGLASLSIEALAVAIKPFAHYPDGFFQRPFTLVLTLFFLATGAWLLRVRGFEGLSVPD